MEIWKSAVRELCTASILLWLALQDKKHLGITRMGVFVASGVLLFAGCFTTVAWQSRLGGIAFGTVLLMFAFFSKEAIGVADGIIVSVCGAAFGLYEAVTACFFAALYTGCCSMALLCAKKVGRKSRIPFLPFFLLGYLTMRVLMSSV